MKIEDCFYIGYITKTKGLKGEVQLFFEFDEPTALDLKAVFIDLNGKLVPFFISSFKLHENQTGNFYFDDITTIEAAEKIIRKKVYLPLSGKPEKTVGEFSYLDLKGYIVQDEYFGEIGEIIEVLEFPQQFIAVVPYKFNEVMFPLNDEIIKVIDEQKGIINVVLPDGLIDIYVGSGSE
jgi:16S rRNA processing protein RimM